jgi:antitoxin YefM
MIAANYTNFRANLKSYMDKAKNDYETIVVTSKDGNVVMLSEQEYNNILENLFIMSNPEMVKRLNESIKQLIEGKTVTFSFEDLKKLTNE